jgi:hypothetical protein
MVTRAAHQPVRLLCHAVGLRHLQPRERAVEQVVLACSVLLITPGRAGDENRTRTISLGIRPIGPLTADIETPGTSVGEMSTMRPMGSRDSSTDTTSALVLSVAIATSAAAGCSVSALAGSAELLG